MKEIDVSKMRYLYTMPSLFDDFEVMVYWDGKKEVEVKVAI